MADARLDIVSLENAIDRLREGFDRYQRDITDTQIRDGLIRQGLDRRQASERIFVVDSRGLVLSDRPGLDAYKADLAQDPSRVAGWQVAGSIPTLLETVRQGNVTALIGLSGQRGGFDQGIVEAVAANTPSPIVFPLSNPTDYSEAVPEDIYRWTDGRAIVATGSPFPEVTWKGVRYSVGQGNNAFIFPGLGLGVKVARAKSVTPGMLSAAAEALADYTDQGRILQGAVYPRVSAMRRVSRYVATAVAQEAVSAGVARAELGDDLSARIEEAMWEARYLPIRRR